MFPYPFRLAGGAAGPAAGAAADGVVCYTSALERAGSAMEVAAIAGRNCAAMVARAVRERALHAR